MCTVNIDFSDKILAGIRIVYTYNYERLEIKIAMDNDEWYHYLQYFIQKRFVLSILISSSDFIISIA